MFRKILVGSDGSSGAKNAVKVAIDLAAKYESELAIISIIEGRPKFATSISEAKMIGWACSAKIANARMRRWKACG